MASALQRASCGTSCHGQSMLVHLVRVSQLNTKISAYIKRKNSEEVVTTSASLQASQATSPLSISPT